MSDDRNSAHFIFASIFFRIVIEWYSFGMAKRYEQYCPMAHALDLVGDRWALLVIRELMHGPKRYTDLVDRLPGIGTNILAARLRDLEAHGVVARRTLPPPAASKVYELTDYGRELRPAMRELALWGARSLGPPTDEDELFDGWLANAMDIVIAPLAPAGRFEFRAGSEVASLVDGEVLARPGRRPRRRGRQATRTASTPCSWTGASTWSRSRATRSSSSGSSTWPRRGSRRRPRPSAPDESRRRRRTAPGDLLGARDGGRAECLEPLFGEPFTWPPHADDRDGTPGDIEHRRRDSPGRALELAPAHCEAALAGERESSS